VAASEFLTAGISPSGPDPVAEASSDCLGRAAAVQDRSAPVVPVDSAGCPAGSGCSDLVDSPWRLLV